MDLRSLQLLCPDLATVEDEKLGICNLELQEMEPSILEDPLVAVEFGVAALPIAEVWKPNLGPVEARGLELSPAEEAGTLRPRIPEVDQPQEKIVEHGAHSQQWQPQSKAQAQAQRQQLEATQT
ncbi:unnamed protein product [Lampetra fluviatilis]